KSFKRFLMRAASSSLGRRKARPMTRTSGPSQLDAASPSFGEYAVPPPYPLYFSSSLPEGSSRTRWIAELLANRSWFGATNVMPYHEVPRSGLIASFSSVPVVRSQPRVPSGPVEMSHLPSGDTTSADTSAGWPPLSSFETLPVFTNPSGFAEGTSHSRM